MGQYAVKLWAGIPRQVGFNSRRRGFSAVKAEPAKSFVLVVGVSMAECGRQIGVIAAGAAQILVWEA
jgi:hypothetical protein